jgi:exopolyphosphatase/guanosine-5'-triphosphate,3'-diphosphate pyrophosphatase
MSRSVPPRFAAVDAGSNTIRLLVASVAAGGRKVIPVHARRETVRLGTGLHVAERLDPAAVARALAALRACAAECARHGARWVAAVATGALRDAADGPAFVERAARETGIRLTLADQETEALLTLRGASAVLGEGTDVAMADIGGRSTELVVRLGGARPTAVGLRMGAVTLTEACLSTDPPAAADLDRLAMALAGILAGLPEGSLPDGVPLAGTGGTFTTLAALDQRLTDYRSEQIDGYRLTLERVEAIVADLVSRDATGRARLAGMERGREDIIVAGGMAAAALLRRLGRGEVVVSDAGILEGAILSGLDGSFPISHLR